MTIAYDARAYHHGGMMLATRVPCGTCGKVVDLTVGTMADHKLWCQSSAWVRELHGKD